MALAPLAAALLVGVAITSIVVWRINLEGLDRAVTAKRSAVKKLVLSGGIPPTQEVMDYLTARQQALEQRYGRWLDAIVTPPAAEAAQADPQLYFQEQVHDLQRTMDRLAAARNIPPPTPLGLPKELPPTDTVPRFLAQLQLAQQTAELIFDQDVSALTSFKVEDPQPMAPEEGSDTFLLVLPVRVRFTGALDHVMKVLGAPERVRPLIDVRSVRLATAADPSLLDAELVVARYTVTTATPASVDQDVNNAAKKKTTKRRTAKPARGKSEE